jgi:hypothetical protein
MTEKRQFTIAILLEFAARTIMKLSAPKKPRFSLMLKPSPGTYADDPRWSESGIIYQTGLLLTF